MAAVVSVKEALRYLAHFLSEGPGRGVIQIEAETIRRAKMNDPAVSDLLVHSICSLIGFLNKFRVITSASLEDKKRIIALYLSTHKNPLTLIVQGQSHFDLSSSRSLLKLLAWLLFSSEDYLGKLDQLLASELLSLEKIQKQLKVNKVDPAESDETTQETLVEEPSTLEQKSVPGNVVKVPGQKYTQLAPLKDRTFAHQIQPLTSTEPNSVKVTEKNSTAEALNRILSIQENQVLKTLFLLKLDKILSMTSHHKKILTRILSSLGKINSPESSSSRGTQPDIMAMLEMLISPDQTGQLIEQLEAAINTVKAWIKDLSLRKSCIEWLDSLNEEDKKTTGVFQTRMSEQEILHQTKQMMATKYADFDEIYNKIDSQIKEMERHAETVKDFGSFWAETSKALSAGPAEYRKIMTALISRENAKLIPKYKSAVQDNQLTSYQALSYTESNQVALDLFKLSFSEKLHQDSGLKQLSFNPIQREDKFSGDKTTSKLKQEKLFDIGTVTDEYQVFIDEVQDFLSEHNISMIRYRK